MLHKSTIILILYFVGGPLFLVAFLLVCVLYCSRTRCMSSKPPSSHTQAQQTVNMPLNRIYHPVPFSAASYPQHPHQAHLGEPTQNALHGLSLQPPPYHSVVTQPYQHNLVVSIPPLADDTGGLPTYEEATRESSPPSFDAACSMRPILAYRFQNPFLRY